MIFSTPCEPQGNANWTQICLDLRARRYFSLLQSHANWNWMLWSAGSLLILLVRITFHWAMLSGCLFYLLVTIYMNMYAHACVLIQMHANVYRHMFICVWKWLLNSFKPVNIAAKFIHSVYQLSYAFSSRAPTLSTVLLFPWNKEKDYIQCPFFMVGC